LVAWDRATPNSYLELNALGEDLRLLIAKPGLDCVLRDVRDENTYFSARHTIRVAALFERSRSGSVLRFVDAKNAVAPDLIVSLAGTEIAVEAKLLMDSEAEAAFSVAARHIEDALQNATANMEADLGIYVLLHNALCSPKLEELIEAVLNAQLHDGRVHKLSGFSIQIQRLAARVGVRQQREIGVLAPIHEEDYLRIRGPARQASKQLRESEIESASGILALGLGVHCPNTVFSFLGQHMRSGRFRGIGAVLLSKAGVHLATPRRTVIDLLELRRNPYATVPLTAEVPLRPLDLGAKLTEVEPAVTDQPAYRFLTATATVTDPTKQPGVAIPDIRRIANALLA
jgi:hypothetical protein